MTSFIFSLTSNDNFALTKKDDAVFHNSNYGPLFGGGSDLRICDNSNVNDSSFANINYTYKNAKYKNNDKDSWLRFSGNPNSHNFRIK